MATPIRSGDAVVRNFFEEHSVPREVPESWVRALSPRPQARWLPRALWLFPLLVGVLGMGTADWDGDHVMRALRDLRQSVAPSPDLRTTEAVVLSVELQTARKLDTDFMRVRFEFTGADGSVHHGKGYFIERDLPASARMTIRHLASNPAIAFPEGGSHGLPGLGWLACLWAALMLVTAFARPLIRAVDRAEVRRILRSGELREGRLELAPRVRPITLAELQVVLERQAT